MSEYNGCVFIGEGGVATADNQLVIALDPNPDNQARIVIPDPNHRALIDRYVRQAGRSNENIIVKDE
ncbi:MAG: hypothetical protein GY861_16490 [bacterium]|nr:hypothetical protein [bacterium]